MNKIWSIGVLICLIYGLITHQENEMFNLLFQIPRDTFEMALKLCLNACFFNGILNIASGSGLLDLVSKKIAPALRFLFKDVSSKTMGYISIHLLSNLFGLGSVATISGLKAMRLLKVDSPNKVSKNMMILFILNTTGLSFFPSTVVALRQSYQTNAPTSFIPYTMLISLITLSIGLVYIHWHE